jgi:lipopolysaccharide export system ATP-binding protein
VSSGSADLLRVEGLSRTIRRRPILRGVGLTVGAGEVVGLLGPNGAGKTTTFKIIAGLDRPEAGRVLLSGRDLGGLPLHRRARLGLGYLPQEPSVFRGLSVLDNVALVLEVAGRRRARQGAESLLEEFGLGHLGQQAGSTLSGGERRRLELARAVCREPAVLVCDEPLTGVDPKAAAELRELIRTLAARGMGVLLTDHNVGEALLACDLASLLVDGRVVESGSSKDLAASEVARALYFGDSPVEV